MQDIKWEIFFLTRHFWQLLFVYWLAKAICLTVANLSRFTPYLDLKFKPIYSVNYRYWWRVDIIIVEVITDWTSVIEAVLATEICDIRVCIWHYKKRTQIRENKQEINQLNLKLNWSLLYPFVVSICEISADFGDRFHDKLRVFKHIIVQ